METVLIKSAPASIFEELPALDIRTAADETLVRHIQAGSAEAFGALVMRYHGRIFAAIVRQGVVQEEAIELTQEVLFKLHQAIPNFRFEASFKTWLLRITSHHVANHFRSRSYRQAKNTVAFVDESVNPNPLADGFDRQAIEQVQQLVASLPDTLREVLVLYSFEQCSYEDIARTLQVPVGTVRSRLHRAREQIRRSYFGLDSQEEL